MVKKNVIRTKTASGERKSLERVLREHEAMHEQLVARAEATTKARLKAAGAGPEVTCKLCGKQFSCLGPHLRAFHDMSGAEYERRFPGAATSSRLRCERISLAHRRIR